jgi:glyoxylase-like metal-dependent hydrolase (beta-lactamase superfamily II)
MKNIKRIILTHLHIDHAQAANEIRNRTGAKIYSHWIGLQDI